MPATRPRARSLFLAAPLLIGAMLAAPPSWAAAPARLGLREGWALQTSKKVAAGGEAVSSPGFRTDGWYRTTVPATVVAAQVAAGEFKDPYRGMNLRQIPGTSYPIGLNSFSNLPMPSDSPYAVPWWYRTEFAVPASLAGKRLWLRFDGINYRANVWVNGKLLASDREIRGAYRISELDATALLRPGQVNVLAVEVHAPTEKQLGINWVDWNPTPADKSMGLWGQVTLLGSGPVSVRHSQVVTHFPDPSLARAELTVMTELANPTPAAVEGVVEAAIDGSRPLQQRVSLAAGERRRVTFAPDRFPALRVRSPRVWWPAEMGQPALHGLRVRFTTGGALSDEQQLRFGIREVTSELTAEGYRVFRINGQRILIRGAGWSQDMLLRPDRARLQAQLQYALDMRLNTIRLEAQLEVDEFFELCDEKGLLVIAGWCCCDIWERWKDWVPGTLEVATEQLRTQTLRLRSHPSLIAWLNGSDGPPPPEVEGAYLKTLQAVAWPTVVVSSAADAPSTVTGPSGVKMSGPYDYEPPMYWYTDERKRLQEKPMADARFGGAYGFNTETGPGPAIPPLQSLKKMLPEGRLWPLDQNWSYHAAGERFQSMNQYRTALERSYGKAASLEDFLRKSQAMAYDGQRAMFEAHGRNKYTATGVIQWLLNNGWPSTFWHLFDYYLYPGGGYFGTKKAGEPLHVQYSYDDRSVVVVNTRRQRAGGLTVSARAYDFALKEVFSGEAKAEVPPDGATRVLTLPPFPASDGAVYFVKLSLRAAGGREVSSNFYWLPAKPSAIDWDKVTDTASAPIKSHEDLTALARLPAVKLTAAAAWRRAQGRDRVTVTVRNPTRQLAFQVHLGVRPAGSEDEVLPVLWEDNYLSLLPGESRTVTAEYLPSTALGKGATLVVDGWNAESLTVPLRP
jgi:exo-1,4-beta-D-glucosaminidase